MGVAPDSVIRLTNDHVKYAARVCARAFHDDPLFAYFVPDARERKSRLVSLLQFSIRYGLLYGEAYATSPNLEGIAVWLSSEISLFRAIRSGGLSLLFRLRWRTVARMRSVMKHVYSVRRNYLSLPHWYLFLICVDPPFQGRGYASALLKPMLGRIDREHLACYLETENQKNLPIYGHYGFKVIADVAIPGTGLHHWLMLREASA